MRGALINRATDLTGISFPLLPVPFNNVVYDTDNIFDPLTPGALKIPPGVSWAKIHGSVRLGDYSAAGSMFLSLYKNGVETYGSVTSVRNGVGGFNVNIMNIIAPWLQVAPDDVFTMRVNRVELGGVAYILANNSTYFAIEVR